MCGCGGEFGRSGVFGLLVERHVVEGAEVDGSLGLFTGVEYV